MKYKSAGLPLLLPILLSWIFDVFTLYLVKSGSWSIISGFMYLPAAFLVQFASFGSLIKSRVLHLVIFFSGVAVYATVMIHTVFFHGLERTNLVDSNITPGLLVPLMIALCLMLELDNIIRIGRHLNRYVILLNRGWMLYFIITYFVHTSSFVSSYLESDVRRIFRNSLTWAHTSAYVLLLVIHLYVVYRNNLKMIWEQELK